MSDFMNILQKHWQHKKENAPYKSPLLSSDSGMVVRKVSVGSVESNLPKPVAGAVTQQIIDSISTPTKQ